MADASLECLLESLDIPDAIIGKEIHFRSKESKRFIVNEFTLLGFLLSSVLVTVIKIRIRKD